MKQRTPSLYWLTWVIAGLLWLILDLVTKLMVVSGLEKPIRIIGNWLALSLHQNEGIAFGINLGYLTQLCTSVLVMVLLGIVGIRILSQEKEKRFINAVLLGIIMGGAVGNLLDRILLGHVIDFIVLKPLPVFNIADIGITLGLIALLALNLKNKPE